VGRRTVTESRNGSGVGSRHERRSLLITANQPFGEWGKVFPTEP
jgi:hypothetical protein